MPEKSTKSHILNNTTILETFLPNFFYIRNIQAPINQNVMKNILLFLLVSLFSAIAIFISTKLADPELGYATAAIFWGFYIWLTLAKGLGTRTSS